jgi:hypothetical protein
MRRARYAAGAVFAFAMTTACASAPNETSVTVAPLDDVGYLLVHPVLERSCGSTDCHGQEPRGLRVYGSGGLRLAGASGPTSAAEIRATYVSIAGLEPEKLNAFTSAQPRSPDQAYHLLLLAKPLALERHRGGISLRKGEPAETCILSWLLNRTDPTACGH